MLFMYERTRRTRLWLRGDSSRATERCVLGRADDRVFVSDSVYVILPLASIPFFRYSISYDLLTMNSYRQRLTIQPISRFRTYISNDLLVLLSLYPCVTTSQTIYLYIISLSYQARFEYPIDCFASLPFIHSLSGARLGSKLHRYHCERLPC